MYKRTQGGGEFVRLTKFVISSCQVFKSVLIQVYLLLLLMDIVVVVVNDSLFITECYREMKRKVTRLKIYQNRCRSKYMVIM